MSLTLDQQKEAALDALAVRRAKNKGAERVDNGLARAGAPMYFYCTCCGEPIIVPENYVTKPTDCPECTTLKERGWLS